MTKFQQFTRERKYIANVSERTLDWYEESLKWLGIEIPTQTDLTSFVIRMREAGLCAASCNNRIRAVNSYLHWCMGSHGKCGPGCQHLKVSKLKEPQKTLPVFDVEDIKAIIRWKAEGYYDKRLQVLLLLLVDTGARISEALGLKWSDVDFDNLLLVLHGKGSKDRKVPFSFELRRRLVKFQHNHSTYVFSTMNGTPVDRHVAARDVRKLCERLEIKRPERMLHAFRHTFSVNYVRKGGSVFHLQKALGHSSLEMSRRYANLNTQDLQDVHQRLSLLAA